MRRVRYMVLSGVWSGFVVLAWDGEACAYVDPGTGSYILQIVIAGLVGAAFTLRLFWRRIRLFVDGVLSRRKNRKPERSSGKDG